MMNEINTTDNDTMGHPTKHLPEAIFISAEVLTILFALVGFVGNLLTVFAILTSNLKTNLNSILIGNLSFAQVIYCSLILPLQALIYHYRNWILPSDLCVLHAAVRFWLIGVNMMLLSAIALYRFLHIVHPTIYSKFSSRGPFLAVVVICWVFSLYFCITPIIGLWGSFSFQEAILQCTFTTSANKSHKITTVTLGFVIPCIFICFCYARIGCMAYFSRKRVTRTASQYRRQKAQKDSLRLTGMMLFIFCGFLLGTTPYFVSNILDPKMKHPLAHIWAPFMAWLLYCMNPVIYTVMDRNFQNAYRRLLTCHVCAKGDNSQTLNAETSYAHR
ncbi:G-protein coupled receptor moody-like [Haliotis rufescens]|uniref:G-protein coupled receptor moody-like n=1 Tax=Haliotis rufescens TaxID=6454 RepID=UPI001EB021FC|nr:G-protein coupled receptor moody-like [Haliotis rufescens]